MRDKFIKPLSERVAFFRTAVNVQRDKINGSIGILKEQATIFRANVNTKGGQVLTSLKMEIQGVKAEYEVGKAVLTPVGKDSNGFVKVGAGISAAVIYAGLRLSGESPASIIKGAQESAQFHKDVKAGTFSSR